MSEYKIPVFLDIPCRRRLTERAPFRPSLVAAIRWDYEYNFMSQRAVCIKYKKYISAHFAREIMNYMVMPEVIAMVPNKHTREDWDRIRKGDK